MDQDPIADAHFLFLLIHHFTGGSDPFNPWSETKHPAWGGGAERSFWCSWAVARPSAAPYGLAPVMDDLQGVMNRLLSAFDLIWNSDMKTEERRHHPALCLKYSSYFGTEGCANRGTCEEVSERLGGFIYSCFTEM